MHTIYDIKERMEQELKTLNKKEAWTCDDVVMIGEMIDVVKDIDTIEAMKNYESEDYMRGYSRGFDEDYLMARGAYNGYGTSREQNAYARNNAYARGGNNSYARGRDAMGRYTSRDDGKQEMIDHLNEMMMNARTPEERESYRSAIEHMSRN